MSDSTPDLNDSLPLSLRWRIEEICSRYDEAWATWKSGKPQPVLVDYLLQLPESERPSLLRYLLEVEEEYRRRIGEELNPQEYEARFPEFGEQLHQFFAGQTRPAATPPESEKDTYGTVTPSPPMEPFRQTKEDNPETKKTGPQMPARAGGEDHFPVVPGYVIERELGQGGMGVVYQARQTALKRLVALKMIRAARVSGEELARFQIEAESVARLQHPHIVQIFEVGTHEGRPYFSLEFVEGGSLDKKLAGTTLAPSAAAQLVQTISLAMQVAHDKGIIHRDLKPANILLSTVKASPERKSDAQQETDNAEEENLGIPKITDFGLAKRLDEEHGHTRHGALLGTPRYMAPEQAAGLLDQVDVRTDVYALGAILYECLTGQPPFKGRNVWDTLEQVMNREPVPVRDLQPRVYRDLETITHKCLHKEAGRRYQSAAELAEDLRRFLNDEPIRARPASRIERLLKWSRRRPALASLYGVLFVAISSLVGLLAWHFSDLHIQLEAARAQVRTYERQQSAQKRLRQLRADVEYLVGRAESASTHKDWKSALEYGQTALSKARGETTLSALHERAKNVHRVAEQGIQARSRLAHFLDQYHATLFHLTRFTGRDPERDLADTRASAEHALGVFAVHSHEGDGVQLDPNFFTLREREDVARHCYVLLLILADVHAGKPGQLPREGQQGGKDALRILERARRLGLNTRIFHSRQARYFQQQKMHVAAKQAREQARNCKITLALDHFLLGADFYRSNDIRSAITAFEEALRLEPNHLWARYFQAICYLRDERNGEARVALGSCLGGEELASDQDSKVRRSRRAWSYSLRGLAQSQLREYRFAEEDFARALLLNPDGWARYGVFVNRGVTRISSGNLTGAVRDLQEGTRLKPKQYQAYVWLADAYQRQKKVQEAIRQLDKAIQLHPQAEFYRRRSRLHDQIGDQSKAQSDLEQAIELQKKATPQLAQDHLGRAKLLFRLKDFKSALSACDQALEINAKLAEAHRLRGGLLLLLGNAKEAEQAFNKALRMGKPSVEVYLLRAKVREQQGNHASALADYTLVLEQQPRNEKAQRRRGWAYLALAAPSLAERDFNTVLQIDSNDAEALSGRGLARVTQGNHREGVSDSGQALKLAPNNQRVAYHCAQTLASASVRVLRDRLLNPRQAKVVQDRYRKAALQRLALALRLLPETERSPYWKNTVEKDSLWNSFRLESSYRELMRLYGQQSF